MTAASVKKALRALSHPDKRDVYQRFFKTGPGEYGEGDVFIGCTMPEIRSVAKEYVRLSFSEIEKLLTSKTHEDRMCGLVILTYQYVKESDAGKKKIFDFYVENMFAANNWDLIDVTVPRIIGDYFLTHNNKIIYTWAKGDLWERRVAILSTAPKIKQGDFTDIFKLVELLIDDPHDLTHKAMGWMLREAWKKNPGPVEKFLKKHVKRLPRTTLRYAIERFEEKKRKRFLRL